MVSTYRNSCSTALKQKKGQNLHDDLHGCRKAFDKIQYPFMIKSSEETGIR
jgi:hypothetical protein